MRMTCVQEVMEAHHPKLYKFNHNSMSHLHTIALTNKIQYHNVHGIGVEVHVLFLELACTRVVVVDLQHKYDYTYSGYYHWLYFE